jgi:hypothetical protein
MQFSVFEINICHLEAIAFEATDIRESSSFSQWIPTCRHDVMASLPQELVQ